MFALQKLSRLNGCLITGFTKCNPGARTSHSLYLWNNQMSGDITFLRKSKHSQKNNWNGSGVQKICQRRTPSRGLKICLPRTKHPNISFNATSTATRLLIWYTRLDSITICSVFFWEVSTQPWVFTSDVPNLSQRSRSWFLIWADLGFLPDHLSVFATWSNHLCGNEER